MTRAQQGFSWDGHATAIAAVATATSTAASFMSDFRMVGYILAGTSILLTIAVAWLRSNELTGKPVKWSLRTIVLICCCCVGLLGWSYFHPPIKGTSAGQSVQTPLTTVKPPTQSRVIYQNETSGPQSPVVTGDGAVVNIGGVVPADSDKKGKKKP
ncbi:hypothetical protein [Terriglobus sp. TAA 43]|uniref:hypothetical protein n=1 Tax=Terriglobus sp. TAA 43 TaxID=278961 RepID=UPI0006475F41|nr:hypothetical protein [Terriglobus sp. TAA 43]